MDMQVRVFRTKGGRELPAFVWCNLLDKHIWICNYYCLSVTNVR